MIVLDTNVLSEPMRLRPDEAVMAWLAAQRDVAVTAVTVGELFLGARRLPHGKRREGLLITVESLVRRHAGRVLPYDIDAAQIYARLQEERRSSGRPLSVEDGMIAATALAHSAALATRNVSDFDGLGLEIVNPWDR